MTETVLCGFFANSAIGGMSETLILKGLMANRAGRIRRKSLEMRHLGFFKDFD